MTVQSESIEHLRETLVRRHHIHRGRLLQVVDDDVRFDDGSTAHREVVLHPGAVAVVPLLDDGRVVLVRQWRHATGRALWEIPAGTRDVNGEPPADTARRELREETGYQAGDLRELGAAFLAPGYSSEEMRFFVANGLTSGEAHTDADERLDVGEFTREDVQALWRRGELDVKSIAGLALAGWQLAADG